MKYTVTDSEGNLLTPSAYKTLVSNLNSSQEISLYFNLMESTNSPGLFLTKSSDLGEVSYPSKESSGKDLMDVLHWGSEDTEAGLYLKIQDQKIYFSFNNGSKYSNRILIPEMANLTIENGETEIFQIILGYDRNVNVSRRLYVGLELYDS